MSRTRTRLTCCAALLAALAFPSAARPLVEVSIVDREDGRLLPQYRHAGDRWVAGTPGHRYAVRLANTTDRRVLVVLSIDGVNAVTGEDADPSQAGYVLEPWQSAQVGGWRKSLDQVAGFHFTALPDSYAARTGRPGNVGVIGIAVFGERRAPRAWAPPRPHPSPYPADAQAQAGAREASGDERSAVAAEATAEVAPPTADASRQQVGTGHGAREWEPVSRTGFVRASGPPAQVTELRYDSPRRLVALGIAPRPDRYWPIARQAPRAFPGRFVPDPR